MNTQKIMAAITAAAMTGITAGNVALAEVTSVSKTVSASAMRTIGGWSGGASWEGLDIADKQNGISTYNKNSTSTGSGNDINVGFIEFNVPAGVDTNTLTLKLSSEKGQYHNTVSAYAAVADLTSTVVSGQTAADSIGNISWANRPELTVTSAPVSYTTGGSGNNFVNDTNNDLLIPLKDENGNSLISYSNEPQNAVIAVYFVRSNSASGHESFSKAELEYSYLYDSSVTEIYVSPNGSDYAEGTQNAPLKTIAAAKNRVREMNANMSNDIYVRLMDGRYELNETLTFTPEDSGKNGYTIHYTAASGAHPILSGGQKLSNSWTKVEGKNYYVIDYERDKKLRSLVVNGEKASMTSKNFSNLGPYGENEYTITPSDENASWFWNTDSVTRSKGYRINTQDESLRNEINPKDVEISTQTTWTTAIVCADEITANDQETDITLQMPYGAIAQHQNWGGLKMAKNASPTIYNVFGWLNDQNGRFYFDKTSNKLYYNPRSGENMDNAEVIVPRLERIIDIQGENLNNRVENIEFNGITFSDTDWNLWEVAGSYGRASIQGSTAAVAMTNGNWHDSIYRAYDVGPAAVTVNSAKNISIINSIVKNTGNDGISFINDVTNSSIDGNSVYDNAGSSVVIGHPQHAFIGDKGASDKGAYSDKEKYGVSVEGSCQNISLKNNYMYNSSQMFLGSATVMAFIVSDLDMEYNHIENSPYAGLSLGWCWYNMDGVTPGHTNTGNDSYSTTHDNKIEYNTFINNVMVLGDSGAIYTLGSMKNTNISHNFIKGIGTPGQKAAYHIRGIHIDEGSSGITGIGNVIELNPEFACIDCGDWSKKGPNTWKNNYSTSNIYSTIIKNGDYCYEPGLTFENLTVREGDLWDKTVFDIIRAAGIRSEYYNNVSDSCKIQDELVPTDFLIPAGTELDLKVNSNDINGEVWLAPAGTVSFAEGTAMAKMNNEGKITVPSDENVTSYYMYIVNGNTVSDKSKGKIATKSDSAKRIFYADDMDTTSVGSGGGKDNANNLGTTQNTDAVSAIFGLAENGKTLSGYSHVNAIDAAGASKWQGYVKKTIKNNFKAGDYTLYIMCDGNVTSGAARKFGLTINDKYVGESMQLGDAVKYSTSTTAAVCIMPIKFTVSEPCTSLTFKIQAPSGNAAPNFIAMALTHSFNPSIDKNAAALSGLESGSEYIISYTADGELKSDTIMTSSGTEAIHSEWYGKTITVNKVVPEDEYIITEPAVIEVPQNIIATDNIGAVSGKDNTTATGFVTSIAGTGTFNKVNWKVTSGETTKEFNSDLETVITINGGSVWIGMVVNGLYDDNAAADADIEYNARTPEETE